MSKNYLLTWMLFKLVVFFDILRILLLLLQHTFYLDLKREVHKNTPYKLEFNYIKK